MKRFVLNIIIVITSLSFMISCATTTTLEDTNTTKPGKSASAYYKSIKKSIATKNLVLADNQYLEMRGEYPESNLLATTILDLALAHMQIKEYLLSRYYCDTYSTDYPYGIRRDYASFLKVKGDFRQFKAISGAQDISDKMDKESKQFLRNFKKSKYLSKVKKMREEFKILRKKRNEEIAETYERTGKLKAAKYYRQKNK